MTTYSFSEYMKRFFENYLLNQRNLSTYTIKSYKTTFKLFINYLISEKYIKIKNINFDIFTRENIIDFLNYLENNLKSSIITRNQRLAAIKSFCNYVLEEDVENHIDLLRILKISKKKAESKEIDYLTKDELNKYLSVISTDNRKGVRDYTLINLLYDSGCRESELINIKVNDLDLDNNPCVTLYGKGRKHRTIPITYETRNLINKYIKLFRLSNYDYLFCGNGSNKASSKMIVHIVKKYAKLSKINKNIHPHVFRHSRAMHMLENNIALIDISNFLGHSSVTTTEIYAKANIELKRKAIQAVYPIDENIDYEWNKDSEILKSLFEL